MALREWLESLIFGPPRVHDSTDDSGEVEATLSEEFEAPAPSDASLERLATGSHLVPNAETAETAADDLESMEAPPDPDP
jgi:hypothetical protein